MILCYPIVLRRVFSCNFVSFRQKSNRHKEKKNKFCKMHHSKKLDYRVCLFVLLETFC